MWPLDAGKLCHALGVEIGSANLDPRDIPAIETVLGRVLNGPTGQVSDPGPTGQSKWMSETRLD